MTYEVPIGIGQPMGDQPKRPALANGWIVKNDFPHRKHGFGEAQEAPNGAYIEKGNHWCLLLLKPLLEPRRLGRLQGQRRSVGACFAIRCTSRAMIRPGENHMADEVRLLW